MRKAMIIISLMIVIIILGILIPFYMGEFTILVFAIKSSDDSSILIWLFGIVSITVIIAASLFCFHI